MVHQQGGWWSVESGSGAWYDGGVTLVVVLGMGGGGRVVEDVAEGAAAPALVYCGLYRLLVLTPLHTRIWRC